MIKNQSAIYVFLFVSLVLFSPFPTHATFFPLPHEIPLEPEIPACCSNVLFIPGIEGSRLYQDHREYFGTSTIPLWEPYGNDQVKKIFMDSSGMSIDPSIYTKDIIDSAYGIKDIYKSFISSMNTLVSNGSINEWKALPYDWRKSADHVTDWKVINEVDKLASTSQTGKIIIVAHSNGGLLAKILMKSLEIQEKSDLVENIIFIAVPELGTPEALLSILHGHDQSIAGGLFLSKNTARSFSQNLPGAYGLLPSREFFNKNPLTVISDLFSNNSNNFASSYESMKNFLLANSFSATSSAKINIPLILNSYILSLADSFHSIIDNWKSPGSTKILSIFGWGKPTSNGIIYKKDNHNELTFEPELTNRGDGTVTTQTNSGNSDNTFYFDLKKLKDDTKKDLGHSDILESKPLQDLISKTIKNEQPDDDYKKYFTITEPIDNDRGMNITIHSPVDINIYDTAGNHTGPMENPVIGRDLDPFEEKIPFSSYDDYDGLKFVHVPYDKNYQINLNGNNNGTFYIDVSVQQYDKVIATTTFPEMPVSLLMNAELVISTSTESLASSSVMYIDVDGDGIADLINHTGRSDIKTYIEVMKKLLTSLNSDEGIEKLLLGRIDKIEKKIDKDDLKKVEKTVKKLSNKLKKKELDESKKSAILQLLNDLLTELESENNE